MGRYYGQLKDESLDPEVLEADVVRLMMDDDVTRKLGIYPYLITGEEKHLNIRAFTNAMKQKAFEIQDGICKSCENAFEMSDMEADHITLGRRAARQPKRTVNCCVRIAIAGNF